MSIFVNRVLNMKKIKVIGFDMDYTLVRYHTHVFEELTHRVSLEKLVKDFKYPKSILKLKYDGLRSIGGLVADKRRGNLLKMSRFGKVKAGYHGLEEIDYRDLHKTYQERSIDLSSGDFRSLDTAFAIANGVLFSQLVEMKKQGCNLPSFEEISDHIDGAVDRGHRDGSIKDELRRNFKKYVVDDPKVAGMLERYKDYGKKLLVITNSDYLYTKDLLNYALNPHLKHHKTWEELFDVVITLSDKPRFFEGPQRFFKIENDQGLMSNYEGPVDRGIFQGGWFGKLQEDLGVPGNQILYLGDHIYGDVVSIKKRCAWRTALVLEDLEEELQGLERSRPIQSEINVLMAQKEELEDQLNLLDIKRYQGEKISRNKVDQLHHKIDKLNKEISDCLNRLKENFNPYWGEVLRAGSEESRFAHQLESYACIYMTRVSDLYNHSPRTYFRPQRRLLPHEQ